MAVRDDVLPDGGDVKSGNLVLYLPYVMGRLERSSLFSFPSVTDLSLWSNAKSFDPDRWLQMNVEPSPYLNVVFNAGGMIFMLLPLNF